MTIAYRFVPWARRGLARAIAAPDRPEQPARAQIAVTLNLAAQRDGQPCPPVQADQTLSLYGPADIIGLDTQLIVRTEPRAHTSNFEPNYLACIDFDPPDLPWAFTPASPTAEQRLRPWLVLLVLDAERIAEPRLQAGAPLPSVRIPAAQAQAELPALDESWLWAHAQGASEAGEAAQLAAEFAARPAHNVSRLISPRRLAPSRRYLACLVPAFEAGRRAGLGLPPEDQATLAPAWTLPTPNDVVLPVYFHWTFGTGPAGDFETLARRIRTPRAYAGDAELMARLHSLGTAPMQVDADRLLTADAQAATLLYEGALVGLSHRSEPLPPDIGPRLATVVNAPQAQLATGPDGGRAPTVAPPLYGAWPARRHRVAAGQTTWLDQLNTDPRWRAAAGLGSAVVQRHQEALMDACWAQVGEVLKTERLLHAAALARFTQERLHGRLTRLPAERLLAVLSPATSHIRMAPQQTVAAQVADTSFPQTLTDASLRRLASAQRPLIKHAVRRAERLAPSAVAGVATQLGNLMNQLAKASANPQLIDPNRFVPDGILGSRSYDRLQLPQDATATVDLAPVGLAGHIGADLLRNLQDHGRSARAWHAQARREGASWRPQLQLQSHQGVLTDTHLLRLAEAVRLAPARTSLTDLVHQVQATPDVRSGEGLLLTMQLKSGVLQSQLTPLRVDGRNGAIRASPAQRTTGVAPVGTVLGMVARTPFNTFGPHALFASLPANTLPAQPEATPVVIRTQTDLPGLFVPVTDRPLGDALTITLPAPLRDRLSVARYRQALEAHTKLWHSPQEDAGLRVRAMDLSITTVAQRLSNRIDPARTVPARLASVLRLQNQPLNFQADTGMLSSPHLGLRFAPDKPYVMPPLMDRIMAYPRLPLPLSDWLAQMDVRAIMPGADAIPNDCLVLTRTNSPFVEAFLVGANHEMGRELLWRGFPTDQRGSPLRMFWDRPDDTADVPELHHWGSRPLGQQPTPDGGQGGNKLVLVLRATLARRFPGLTIYAWRKDAQGDQLARPAEGAPPQSLMRRPLFSGLLPPDMLYVGFDIPADNAAEVHQWCFVLEETLTEPRFGFDEADSTRARSGAGSGWSDVSWPQVLPASGEPFVRLAHLMAPPPGQTRSARLPPGAHAAHAAAALMQRPFRAYFLGRELMT